MHPLSTTSPSRLNSRLPILKWFHIEIGQRFRRLHFQYRQALHVYYTAECVCLFLSYSLSLSFSVCVSVQPHSSSWVSLSVWLSNCLCKVERRSGVTVLVLGWGAWQKLFTASVLEEVTTAVWFVNAAVTFTSKTALDDLSFSCAT